MGYPIVPLTCSDWEGGCPVRWRVAALIDPRSSSGGERSVFELRAAGLGRSELRPAHSAGLTAAVAGGSEVTDVSGRSSAVLVDQLPAGAQVAAQFGTPDDGLFRIAVDRAG